MTFAELCKSGQRVKRDADSSTLQMIKDVAQQLYFTMCRSMPVPSLRRTITLAFTPSLTDGMLLPANMAGIQRVVNELNQPSLVSGEMQRVYYPTDESLKYQGDGKYHWYFRNMPTVPLVNVQNGIDIAQGATNFTGIGVDYTGEYIRFGSEPGLYLLNGVDSIATPYTGQLLTNKGAIIRPPDARRMCIIQPDGTPDGATVTVYYWQLPDPLYTDNDIIMLPDNGRALQLKLWVELIGPMDKRKTEADQYRAELYGADGSGGEWNELVSMCGKSSQPAIPRDRHGRIIYFGRQRIISNRNTFQGVDLGM